MQHPFQQFISQYTFLPQKDWELIESCLSKRFYPKGATLLQSGEICRKIFFLESGFLRYYLLKDGIEVSKFFTIPPYCFTSQRSFNLGIPAQESIEALEDSVVWEIKHDDTAHLLSLNSWNTFTRKLIQEVQFFTEQILIDIQNQTAEERYLKMLKEGHIFLQKVPIKHLASYLGIAPQSLSRIRKKALSSVKK